MPPIGGFASPATGSPGVIPHKDLVFDVPERVHKLQGRGVEVPCSLFTLREYEKLVPGFSKLSKSQQAELSYRLPVERRLDDVLDYIEQVSAGVAPLNLPALHRALGEARDLASERTDGLTRLATIKDGRGEDNESEQSHLSAMDTKQRRRQAAAERSPLHQNVYEHDAVALQAAVDRKTQQLLATPHAYQQIRSRYGAAAAQQAFKWGPTDGAASGGGSG